MSSYGGEGQWSVPASTESIARAGRAATALAAAPPPDSASVCMAEVEQLGQVLDQLEAAISSRVARVDASGEVRGWGYPSTSAWLRHRLGTRHGRAVERVVVARQLPRLPQVAKRLAAGELSYGYACEIARGVKHLDDHDTGAAEHIVLDLIDNGATVAEVIKTCARITDIVNDRDDNDIRSRAQRRDHRRSWLSVTTDLDGNGAHVTGWLTATHASMLRQTCAPLTVPAGAADDRDHPQRFADALYTHLSQGGRTWNATIVIDYNTLTAASRPNTSARATASGETADPPKPAAPQTEPAAAQTESPAARAASASTLTEPAVAQTEPAVAQTEPAVAQTEPAAHAEPPAPAETAGPAGLGRTRLRPSRTLDGLTVPAAQARQIALNAGINALILGPSGLPLYLGRKTRLVTPAQHKTLMAQYETCIADGCTIPAHLCQIDHIQPWTPHGPTDIDNLAPQCAYHHRYKHQHPERIHLTRQHGRWKYDFRRPPPLA